MDDPVETIVIGAGQAGLAMSWHLSTQLQLAPIMGDYGIAHGRGGSCLVVDRCGRGPEQLAGHQPTMGVYFGQALAEARCYP
jgi:hypothetical protein